MAAPSGIKWGNIYSGNSRLGVYVGLTNTNTQTTVNVQVWFWTIYSCVDDFNTLYYNAGTGVTSATTSVGSIKINHTVASGASWNTANQTKLLDKTYTYDRGTSAVTYNVYAKYADIDLTGQPTYANASYTVPALASYTVSYNANGGSGAPSSQTKWYGKALTLSSSKPTRTGYSFQGWATSDSGGVAYAAGGSYTGNANITLYAVWKANTYKVSYNANGGSGAPSSQTKTYGLTLTLSSSKPARTNYNFLGWATSASSTTVSYKAGATYTSNADITLYAVWELAYVKPRLYNLSAERCNADGVLAEDGTCALVSLNWETDKPVSSIMIMWVSATAGSGSSTVAASGTIGSIRQIVGDGAISPESSYSITVTVSDSEDRSNVSTTLNGLAITIDCKAGGGGVSFGKPAELGTAESLGRAGVADFGFDAKFNEPVYGNVLGLSSLPEIPRNSDLNDYMETGCWATYRNEDAGTIANMPPKPSAGKLEVSAATGEGVRLTKWSYLRQRFIPYSLNYPVWERDISRSDDNVWNYGPWTITSIRGQKVLWSGVYYMNDNQSIVLSDLVSNQPNGVVLVFSRYSNGAAEDSNFNQFFVAKKLVELMPGCGHCFQMTAVNFSYICAKYLYISNDRITGNAINEQTGSNNGVTYANNSYVLRYVLGV